MMIIVSKLADYAVVLAVQLGHMGQKIGSSAGLTQASTVDLAEMTKLPGATVAKVLKALHRAGIVLSARGAGGGLSACPGSSGSDRGGSDCRD